MQLLRKPGASERGRERGKRVGGVIYDEIFLDQGPNTQQSVDEDVFLFSAR